MSPAKASKAMSPAKASKVVKKKPTSNNSPTKSSKSVKNTPAKSSKANTNSPTKNSNQSKPKKIEKTVFTRDTSMRRTVIIAHNGGNFGPDNSMKNFKGAIDNKAEGIEFDVSANHANYHFCQTLSKFYVIGRCG